jgi:hypothetical protein
VETFTDLKDFADNPHYREQRQKSLRSLDLSTIDAPIIEIIEDFTKLSYCFTLQSCFGHFVFENQKEEKNTKPLPVSEKITNVEYRIAYIALCLEDSDAGRQLFNELSRLPAIDPDFIQFGCAEWFWKDYVNSYALQVEPERYKTKDRCMVSYHEAQRIEKARNEFFTEIKRIITKKLKKRNSSNRTPLP